MLCLRAWRLVVIGSFTLPEKEVTSVQYTLTVVRKISRVAIHDDQINQDASRWA